MAEAEVGYICNIRMIRLKKDVNKDILFSSEILLKIK